MQGSNSNLAQHNIAKLCKHNRMGPHKSRPKQTQTQIRYMEIPNFCGFLYLNQPRQTTQKHTEKDPKITQNNQRQTSFDQKQPEHLQPLLFLNANTLAQRPCDMGMTSSGQTYSHSGQNNTLAMEQAPPFSGRNQRWPVAATSKPVVCNSQRWPASLTFFNGDRSAKQWQDNTQIW